MSDRRQLTRLLAALGLAMLAGCGSTPGESGDGGDGSQHHDASKHGDGGKTGGKDSGSKTDGGGGGGKDSSGATDSSGGGDTGPTLDGAIFGDGGGACLKFGSACKLASDCCSSVCTSNVCEFPACTSDGLACTSGSQCCSGICGSGGTCTPLSGTCKTLGNACTTSTDCCSGLCAGGVCSASSFCEQNGDICIAGSDCCGGVCDIKSGASVGTCAQPPAGASNCTAVDGTLCGGIIGDGGTILNEAGLPSCGGACCSRLCAPFGPTGVLICQPATGCHVVGDLCTKDSDCCGSAGLPGEPKKPVTCSITPPDTVGICRNPMMCKPNGDICKLSFMSCNASCDCCSGNCETMDTCRQDLDGVPRCTGAKCVDAGASCASSADCCDGLPCVPDPTYVDGGTGHPYICGSTPCVNSCGLCTTTADCCPGTSCVLPIGSATGVCGPCVPDGGPGDGGGKDGSTMDGGTKDSGPPPCSMYGQKCTMSSQCCSGVPCSGPLGPCAAGETDCTCHYSN
jgi:hypothetical protein